jgi:hypothetical protein
VWDESRLQASNGGSSFAATQDFGRVERRAGSIGFVLYGGTAIALRLGHRASIDFDFFSDKPLDRRALSAAVPLVSTAKLLQETPGYFSFFAALKMGRVGQPEWTEDGVLQVASLDDLLAAKLKVLLQRVEAKDYLDLAAMLEAGAKLSAGLAPSRMPEGPDLF